MAGRVEQVTMSGALPPGATGSRTADLVWQDGPNARVTTVVHLSEGLQEPPPGLSSRDRVVGDLGQQLEAWDRHATLEVLTGADLPTHARSIAGWQLPVWMGQVAEGLWVAAVLLLATGPQPRWATRWAWFWAFILVLVVGFGG